MQYSILELLGHGFGGVAYRAQDNHGENVVFKFSRPHNASNPYDLFERESKNLQLTNRFIYADQENRILIFKMIPGITYAKYLSNILQKFTESGLSDIEYADLQDKVHLYNSALKDFHSKYGLVHGDVRPLNAIITPDGKMELIDLANSEVSSADPIVFSEQMRFQYGMARLELFYWASWSLRHFRRNTITDDYRHLLILQATPGRENEAQTFCQHYQETHNLPTDTCEILELEYRDLQAKTKDLISQMSPTLEDLNALAKDLRKRFMFIEEGMIDLKLSLFYGATK
jgi:serine/threonine protein kinase